MNMRADMQITVFQNSLHKKNTNCMCVGKVKDG